jgi:hypothetical protein
MKRKETSSSSSSSSPFHTKITHKDKLTVSPAPNSMVTACIVLLYVSYSIPVITLLARGRNNIRHGPFWLGGVGAFANYVLLGWTLFTIIMYSFPYYYPATATSEFFIHSLSLPCKLKIFRFFCLFACLVVLLYVFF